MTQNGGYIWSADFVDPDHGWLLTQDPTVGEMLVRTRDGGKTWTNLGSPVLYSDWAYRVLFASPTEGWLYSQSTAPYAYKSEDGGSSWIRMPLPNRLEVGPPRRVARSRRASSSSGPSPQRAPGS